MEPTLHVGMHETYDVGMLCVGKLVLQSLTQVEACSGMLCGVSSCMFVCMSACCFFTFVTLPAILVLAWLKKQDE